MSGWDLDEIAEKKTAQSKAKPTLKQPRKFKVLLINDDYTPMDFVVEVIRGIFYMSEEAAVQIMLQVHYQGKGVCGVFTHDIAETKVAQVNEYSKKNEHPLLCSMEPE